MDYQEMQGLIKGVMPTHNRRQRRALDRSFGEFVAGVDKIVGDFERRLFDASEDEYRGVYLDCLSKFNEVCFKAEGSGFEFDKTWFATKYKSRI